MGVTVEKCLQAWTNSLRQMNAKAEIVFFGDSLTYYGDFSSVFPDKLVCNLGLRGDTISGMIDRVEQVKLLEPKIVYLMAGINDIASVTLNEFRECYKALVKVIVDNATDARVNIFSLLPVNSIDFSISCDSALIPDYNKIIADVAANFNLQFIDIYSIYEINNILPLEYTLDGIHLKKEAYLKWYNELREISYYHI